LYAGYKFNRSFTQRHRHLFVVIIIILTLATAVSIAILFLRGFRFTDLSKQLNQKTLTTPSMKVWLIEVDGFQDKMAAYKKGVVAANDNLGVYVISDNNQWNWIAGVYMTEEEARQVINQSNILKSANCKMYEIKSKNFQMHPETIEPCCNVFVTIKNIFDLLLQMRTYLFESQSIENLLIDVTSKYNELKDATEKLHLLNEKYKNEIIATLIYAANQNILSLQDIIYDNNNCSLAAINTALLNAIFSLDNF